MDGRIAGEISPRVALEFSSRIIMAHGRCDSLERRALTECSLSISGSGQPVSLRSIRVKIDPATSV
jgi:hypothetical protein